MCGLGQQSRFMQYYTRQVSFIALLAFPLRRRTKVGVDCTSLPVRSPCWVSVFLFRCHHTRVVNALIPVAAAGSR